MRVTILLIAVLSASTERAASQTMSWQGVGAVGLGMTVSEAERAIGAQLTPRADGVSEECWVTQRADGKDPTTSYMVMEGKIVLIEAVSDARTGQATKVTDARGIGVGSSEADIRRAYGNIKVELAPGNSEEAEIEAAKTRARLGIKLSEPEPALDYWVKVDSPTHERALIFDTRDSKVRWMRTGFNPIVMVSEGCSR